MWAQAANGAVILATARRNGMTPSVLRGGAFVIAALVIASGAAYPLVAAHQLGLSVAWPGVLEVAVPALAPALGLVVVARQARSRVSSWAALVGSLLTLALGVALYAAALEGRPRTAAAVVAFVSVRQLVAAAFSGWAVWITRSL